MKLISWNVNGLRACLQKGFLEYFNKMDADFFCLQETKLQEGQVVLDLPGYEQYWCCAEKKGYSGTAVFTKHTPQSVTYGLGVPELDTEGRMITLEYPEFYLVTCYTPNAQRGLARIDHRMRWDEAFRSYISGLDAKKPVILCGDLNVAHQEIDLKNPGPNRGNAGFSDQERESFTKTLSLGFTDTFRHLNPDTVGAYTWWSYMFHARENNAGWRIDYFLVSDRIRQNVYRAPIYADVLGSDHCPVGLEIDLLCNGSIWPPASQGEATLLFPAEKPKAPSPAPKAVISTALAALLTAGCLFGGYRLIETRPAATESEPSATESEPFIFSDVTEPLPDIPLEDWFDVYPYSGTPNYVSLTATTKDGFGADKDGFVDNTTHKSYQFGNPTPAIPETGISENFRVRLHLTDEGKARYDGTWAPTFRCTDQEYTVYFCPYYDRDDPSVIAGWFYCGNLSTVHTIASFSYDQVESITLISYLSLSPAFTYADTADLSTYELVSYVAQHSNLQDKLASIPSGPTALPDDKEYRTLSIQYPPLMALQHREDAIDECFNFWDNTVGISYAPCYCIVHLLGLSVYQEKMDSTQLEKYQLMKSTLDSLILYGQPDLL